jgi:hypothetical protein
MKINCVCLSLFTFAFLKIIDSFFIVKNVKTNNINNIYLKKKTSGCDERYEKIQNITDIIEHRIQYAKTLFLFHSLKILQDEKITDKDKIDFIQMNDEFNLTNLNNSRLNNRLTSSNVYSGGLLNNWEFDFL